MNFSDLISITIFIFVGKLIARQSRLERNIKLDELEKRKNHVLELKQQEEDELIFANKALGLLPDFKSSLRLLREKYAWIGLVETLNINLLDLRLLREVSYKTVVNLPNMNENFHGPDEKRVLNRAIELSAPYEKDFHIVSGNFQEPTTDNLDTLESLGFVRIKQVIDKNTFSVELSKKGKKLYAIDSEFKDHNDGFPGVVINPKSKDAKKVIARIICSALL